MTRWRLTDRATGEGRDLYVDDPADTLADTPADGDHGELASRAVLGERLEDGAYEVIVDGWRFVLDVEDARLADLRARASIRRGPAADDGPTEVRAIIPGRVVAVAVAEGDAVTAGARLLSVEAMKMENEVRAPRDGQVTRILVAPGTTVDLGDVLVVLR